MGFSFKIASRPDCISYFSIVKDDTNYTMEEFVHAFYTEPYSIEHLLPSCHIVYRGIDLSADEYARNCGEFYDSLAFHERYNKEVYPLEMMILPSNQDYYRAAKFLRKCENCLQTARYYLGCSWDKFEDNENLARSSGYRLMFYIRTVNLSTAAIWYNSCCDYLLLVVYFAFGLYKMIDGYTDGLSHEHLLKLCTYENFGRVYSQHKERLAGRGG